MHGISYITLSNILKGHAGISPEMADRLFIAFNTTSESLLNQQLQYGLWLAEKERKTLNVKKLVT